MADEFATETTVPTVLLRMADELFDWFERNNDILTRMGEDYDLSDLFADEADDAMNELLKARSSLVAMSHASRRGLFNG